MACANNMENGEIGVIKDEKIFYIDMMLKNTLTHVFALKKRSQLQLILSIVKKCALNGVLY